MSLPTEGHLRFHGDQITAPEALNFAVNIWVDERPEALERALLEALERPGYPDQREAVLAVARRHHRPPEEVLLLNGASEAFWLLAHTLRPSRAVCVHPSFTEPEAALRAVGAEVVQVVRRPDDWRLEPEKVPEEAELVVLGNPNNPTGTLDAREEVPPMTRPDRMVVIDESFMPFMPEERESLASVREPGLVVVRSLTKVWSLAGIRAGYLLAPAEIVSALAANRQPWSVNAIACAAIAVCADDHDTPRRVAAEAAKAREELAARLAASGIRVWPSVANFLLLEVPDGPRVVEALKSEGIVVRPASSFPGLGSDHIRVAVRSREDNVVLADALAGAVTVARESVR